MNQELGQNAVILGNAHYFDKGLGQHGEIIVTIISIVKPTPLDIAPIVKKTDSIGNYSVNVSPGTYIIIAEDPNKEYYPATTQIKVENGETKTAEDLILTKAIQHVIIFREQESGWCNAGVPYTVMGDILTSELGMTEGSEVNQYEYRSLRDNPLNLTFNIGDLIIIEGDQPQDFYDTYTTNKSVFDDFVHNGGTIFWVASDMGWANGDFTSSLPGRVTWRDYYDDWDDIANFDHPITKKFSAQLYGNHASHGGFDNLNTGLPIVNLMIYVKETSGGLPTYIEYRYGSGRVLATTTPLEWYVDNGSTDMPQGYNTTYKDLFKLMLVRSIRYIMNLTVSSDIPPSLAPTVEKSPKVELFSNK